MKNIIFKVELNKVFQDDKRDIIITDRKGKYVNGSCNIW